MTNKEISYAKKVLYANAVEFGTFSGSVDEFIAGLRKAIENGECMKEDLFADM